MADTTTSPFGFTKPEIGASEDTWGTKLNANWEAVDNCLDGTTAIKPNLTESQWKVGGTAVTATAAELNILDGVTSTTAELNILDGVTSTTAELNILDGVTSTAAEINLLDGSASNTVVNGKAVVYGASGEVQATTVDLGDWTITQSGSSLVFSYGGSARFQLTSAGELTVEDDVVAFGSL
jgi:hypothetical protein